MAEVSERLDEIRRAVQDKCSTHYWYSNREHEAYTDYIPFLLAEVERLERRLERRGDEVSTRAVFYKGRERKESMDVRSDFAAKQYAGRKGYDSIEVQSVYGGPSPRYHFLNRHGWRGPVNEEDWLYEYMKVRKDFSAHSGQVGKER